MSELYFIYNARAEQARERVEIAIDKIIPDMVKYQYQPNFEEQSLLGRRSPVFLYTAGSKKTFDFSLKFHQDFLNLVRITENGESFQPTSIVEFVEHLKMLSYPMTRTSGETSFPQIYFELGELSGYGYVNVSVSWEKPWSVQTKNYMMATISFSVTVEKSVSPPTEPQTRTESVEYADLFYDYKISSNITQDEAEDLAERLGVAFTGSVEDLISNGEVSQFATAIQKGIATENYDFQVERLKNIYELFRTSTGEELPEDLEDFKEVTSFDYEELYTRDSTDAEAIKDMKKAFKGYLDYYYDDVNTRMTRDEYYEVIESVFTTLERLQEYAEEIYGYGESG